MTFGEKIKAINEFEKKEGYPINSLLKPMLFETAGTLSTSIVNPLSGAVGLIQFLPITLSGLGFNVAAAKSMTFEEQLCLVKKYLAPYKSKLLATKDPIDFYLSILYPALIGKSDSSIMASSGSKTYTQNKGLDYNKDGVITKGDIRLYFNSAVNRIAKRKGITFPTAFPLTIAALFIFLSILFFNK